MPVVTCVLHIYYWLHIEYVLLQLLCKQLQVLLSLDFEFAYNYNNNIIQSNPYPGATKQQVCRDCTGCLQRVLCLQGRHVYACTLLPPPSPTQTLHIYLASYNHKLALEVSFLQ